MRSASFYLRLLCAADLVLLGLLEACGGGSQTGIPTPPPPPSPSLSLQVSPSTLTLVPGNSAPVRIAATEIGSTATPSVTLGTLPQGVTTTTTFPLPIPPGGTTITFQAAATAATGSFPLSISGQAGTLQANAVLSIAVEQAYDFFFDVPEFSEIAAPFGGSASISFQTGMNGPTPYTVALSVTGLPPGTSATFNPPSLVPGGSGTLTITAAANAPLAQNVPITLVGTPSINGVPSRGLGFLLDVTPPPGQLPNNRTAYLSTEGTPYWAVYDSVHGLVFSSNNSWNRVDIINATTRTIVKSIAVRDPRGMDMAVDDSRVWLTTGSQVVYEIDPVKFTMISHSLPAYSQFSPGLGSKWEGNMIYALSDGTLLLYFQPAGSSGPQVLAIWNPATNAFTKLPAPPSVSLGLLLKSGDGSRIYSISGDSSGNSYYYDVPTQTLSAVIQLGGYALDAAANYNGTLVAIYDLNGLNMYDGGLNLLGPLPGGGLANFLLQGGMVFSPGTGTLYEVCNPAGTPVILTIDPNTRNVLGVAPAMPFIPVMEQQSDGFDLALPIGVDPTGIIIGIQDYGIAFDDSTFYQNLLPTQPGTPTLLQHMSPYTGPLAGGTTSSGFGNAVALTPDVWYGPNRGVATVSNGGFLSISSPPGSAPGPVDIKMLFPDGLEIYDALFFSYGPQVQYSVLSASGPDGGGVGRIAGFGIPISPSGGTLTIGGAAATITTSEPPQYQYFLLTGSPFPNTYLSYQIPSGSPGWADITVQTPGGSSTLSRSFFYAQSVTDYTAQGAYNAVLFDRMRNQLYLSANDHIDVFSLASSTYQSPIVPPAQGSTKQFEGMALTPDGNSLLVADLVDGSLAVVNLANPSASTVIPVAPTSSIDAPCILGPSYVAATSTELAFVTFGGVPGPGCGAFGPGYLVNLAAKTAGLIPASPNCSMTGGTLYGAGYVSASLDGSVVALGAGPFSPGGFCVYNSAQGTFAATSDPGDGIGVALSADGNVAAAQFELIDSSANEIGRIGQPDIYYNFLAQVGLNSIYPLQVAQLNDAGSLYFMPYQNFIDIIDVQHGLLRMRLSLAETVNNVAAPMALDSSGQRIFLLTAEGLTVVDLGAAPLSIGSLNPSQTSAGAQIAIRGSGFVPQTTATIGGTQAVVTYVDSETLQVTVPALAAGAADLVLTNPDGSTYTLNSAVTIQ